MLKPFLISALLAAVLTPGLAFSPRQSPRPPQSQNLGDSQPVQADPIHVGVDRVNVGVIVTDSHGNFIPDLRRQDFHVFDNGAEQPVTDFATIDEPAEVLLLIEAGPAVYLLESGHLHAAYTFLEGLAPADRVAVAKYAESPQALLDFTPDKQAAESALENLNFNLGFGALDLSGSLSTVLDWLANAKGKRTIVLLSTGVDTSPANQINSTLERLKTSDIRLLAISLSGPLRNTKPAKKNKLPSENAIATAQEFAEADELLKALAEASGGRAYFPLNAKDFAAVYGQIAQLVRHEYFLAFAPPIHDGQVHSIEVRVQDAAVAAKQSPADSALRIAHRRAYIAPAH